MMIAIAASVMIAMTLSVRYVEKDMYALLVHMTAVLCFGLLGMAYFFLRLDLIGFSVMTVLYLFCTLYRQTIWISRL